MSLKSWLKQDKIAFGLLLGLIIPMPAALIFAFLIRIIQNYLHFFTRVRDTDLLLLGVAINLIIMRYYFVKYKLENTAKGIMIITLLMVLAFFLFLKNSSLTFPF